MTSRHLFSPLLQEYGAALRLSCRAELRHLRAIDAFLAERANVPPSGVRDIDVLLWARARLRESGAVVAARELLYVGRFFDFLVTRGDRSDHPLGDRQMTYRRSARITHLLETAPETDDGAALAARFRALEKPSFRSGLAPSLIAFASWRETLGYRGHSLIHWLGVLDGVLADSGVSAVDELDAPTVRRLAARVRQVHRSQRVMMKVMRRFLHYLARRQQVAATVLQAVPRIRWLPHSVFAIPTLKDFEVLLAHFDEYRASRPDRGFRGLTYRVIVHLAYACGLRIGELRRLRLCDVDGPQATLRIVHTKFGKQRLVPLGLAMAAQLQRYIDRRIRRFPPASADDALFVRDPAGKPVSESAIRTFFRGACRDLGIRTADGRHPRFHDIRHAFAVHRLEKWYHEGADVMQRLMLLSTYMGHSSVLATQHYLHLSPHLLHLAAQPLARAAAPNLQWDEDR